MVHKLDTLSFQPGTDTFPFGISGGCPSLPLALASGPSGCLPLPPMPYHLPAHHAQQTQLPGRQVAGWSSLGASISHNRGVARAQSKQLGPKSLQNTLILKCGCSPHRKGPLYTRRTSLECRAVAAVSSGPPRTPDQPAQGLSAGSPLPQLCVVHGATKPAPLADRVYSSHRELQVGSGGAGILHELGTCKHTCEQGRAVNITR